MKSLACILALFCCIQAYTQQELSDTIKIKAVSIKSEKVVVSNSTEIDSAIMLEPTNQSLADLVSKQSPVFVKTYGIGSLATVSLRGSGSTHTNIMWEGIQLNSSMNGLVDLSLFPSFFLEEANVVYGTSSLEGATGGIGGAVQMNSNSNIPENSILLNQQLGSFGFYNIQAALNYKYKKLISKTKVFRKTANNNFIYNDIGQEEFPERELENAKLNQYGIKQDIYWNRNERSRYGVQFWYQKSDRSLPSIFTVNNVVENQLDESLRVLINSKFYFKNSSLKLASAVLKEQVDYNNEVAGINSISKGFDSKSYIEYERKWNPDLVLKAKSNLDFSRAEQAAFDGDLKQSRVSNFVSLNKKFNKGFSLEALTRNENIIGEESFILPAVQLSHKSKKYKITSIAKWGKNLKYPTWNDSYWIPGGNPNLMAEQSSTVEVGVQKVFKLYKRIELETELNLCKSEIENYILWRPTNLGFWQALNLKNVESEGVEFNAKLKSVDSKLKKLISFNYSYVSSVNGNSEHEFDQSEGKQLIYIPEHQYNVYLKLDYKRYSFSYNNQFVGARYTTTDNTEFLSYYSLHDITFSKSWKLKKNRIELGFSIMNLLDVEYQAIQWRPMPGRNYLLNLRYKINEK